MNTSTRPIDEIRSEKIKKINSLISKQINPFPAFVQFQVTSIKNARTLKPGKSVAVRGKVEKIRAHGKLIFLDITDFREKIQLYLKK